MPKERYNIKEFAAIVGRSEQGVYARLSKRLKPYLTERGGVLMLDYKAFSDVYGLSKEQVETRIAQLDATPQRSNHRIRRGRWTEKLSERMAENNSQRAFERKIAPDSPPDSPKNAPTAHSQPQNQSEAPKTQSETPQNHSDTPKSHSNTPKSPISSTKTDLEQELYEQMKARITDQRDQIESLQQQIQSLTRLLDQEQQLKLVSLHQNHEAISSAIATEKTEPKHPVNPSEHADIEPHTATPSTPHRATSPLWLTVLLALLVLALGALLAALYWGLL